MTKAELPGVLTPPSRKNRKRRCVQHFLDSRFDVKADEAQNLEETPDQSDIEQEDEDVVLIRGQDPKKAEIDEEADADFDREFAKMMADTTDARRGDSRRAPPPVFDTAIPHVKKREEREVEEGKMNFTLLSKKGNRPQVNSISLLQHKVVVC